MTIRNLFLLASTAVLALFLTACCCGGSGDSDWQKTLEEASKGVDEGGDDEGSDDGDEGSDDGDDDSAKKEEKDEGGGGGGKLASMNLDSIKKGVEGEGWKVLGKPTETDIGGIKTTIITCTKGTKGGSVAHYKTPSKISQDTMVKSFANQDSATKTEGDYLLAVTIPGHKDEAKKLLDALTK